MNFIKKMKSVILPATTGNILEWYDFTLYAYFSTVFAKHYFPAGNPQLAILEVYGLFAVSYIMRPIGALFFGYLGDRYGRKISLAYSVILMGFCSLCVAILPTYAKWGIMASVLLAAIRLLQGFAVGGEYSGATIYLIESAPTGRKTFFGSLALASAYSGFVLSAAVGAFLSSILTNDQLTSWGWRLGFLFGSGLAFIGFYVRSKLKETNTFSHQVKSDTQKINPLKNLLYYHPKTFLLALGVALLPAGFSYMVFVYFGNFLNTYANYSTHDVFIMTIITMLTAVTLIPFIGFLADYIGRRKLMMVSVLGIMGLSIPLFKLLPQYPLMILISFTLLNALYESNIPAEVSEMFEANYRYSGLALTLNLTNGIAGGLAPIIASLLIQHTNQLISPMYYIITLSIITFSSLLVSRK